MTDIIDILESPLVTEDDYRLLEALGKKLKIPIPSVHLAVIASLDGKETGRFEGRSKTWNRNFWNWAIGQIAAQPFVVTNFGAGYISLKRHNNNVAAVTATSPGLDPSGPAGNINYGLVPGRGGGAEDLEGYELTTPIAHGTGGNQLSFRVQAVPSQAYTSATRTWVMTLTRLFDNTSGATITITEVALKYIYSALTYYYMFSRDLLGTPVDVLNNGILTITQTMTLIFPA